MQESSPLVSIVLATYNGQDFLRLQLDSIVKQTYPHLEVIVTDDCSTDDTVTIINEYTQKYPFFRLYENVKNVGYIQNFEKGMLLAKGDFIALSDQDDIWNTDKVSILVSEISDAEIIYSNSELVDEQGQSLHKRMSEIKNQIAYDNCLMYSIGAWAPGHAMMIKRDLVSRCVPFPLIVTHDFWLGFIATCNGPIKYLDTPLVSYRQHQSNVIGAVTGAKRTKRTRQQKRKFVRERMALLYEKCPSHLVEQKMAFRKLLTSYQSFSLQNNILRMLVFFKYRHLMLAYKKKNAFQQIIFCLKMFVTIV